MATKVHAKPELGPLDEAHVNGACLIEYAGWDTTSDPAVIANPQEFAGVRPALLKSIGGRIPEVYHGAAGPPKGSTGYTAHVAPWPMSGTET